MSTITNANVFDYVTMVLYKKDEMTRLSSFPVYCMRHNIYNLAEEILGFVKFSHHLGILSDRNRNEFLLLFKEVGFSETILSEIDPQEDSCAVQNPLLNDLTKRLVLSEDYCSANEALLMNLCDCLKEQVDEAKQLPKNKERELSLEWNGQQPTSSGFYRWAYHHWSQFREQQVQANHGFDREPFVDLHGKFLLYSVNALNAQIIHSELYKSGADIVADLLRDLDLADKVLAWKKQRMLQSV